MKKYFLLVILFALIFLWLGNYTHADCTGNGEVPSLTSIWCNCTWGFKRVDNMCKKCSDPGVCCGIQLNTTVPFIGNCIESESGNVGSNEEKWVTWDTAFPVLMWSLTKILVTVILIISFVLIVVWGIMISTGNVSWWKDMIIKVAAGIAILWASGVILRLINPNFFG